MHISAKKKRRKPKARFGRADRCRVTQKSTNAQGEAKTRHLGSGHIQALDGLRGCAVLAVMVTHLLTGNLTQLPQPVASMLGLGVAGVDVFFVLSGFLITGILFSSLEDSRYFSNFYARRALRIFPLYYGVLLVLMCLTVPLHIEWDGRQWSLLLYLQNTQSFFPSLLTFHNAAFSVDHLWSLAVEEQFYLVWPMLIALSRTSRRVLLLCVFGMVLSFCLRVHCLQAGYEFNWVNRNTLCRVDELLAGAALAVVLRSSLAERAIQVARPLVIVSTIAVLSQALLLPETAEGALRSHPYLVSAHYVWNLCLAAGLILCCVRPSTLR